MQVYESTPGTNINPKLRVGLDISFLDRPPSGIGTYVAALRTWIPLVAPEIDLVDLRPHPHSPLRHLGERGSRFAWEYGASGIRARREKVNLIHMPMLAAPVATRLPIVATVHDVIPFVMPEYRASRAQRVNLAVGRRLIGRAAAIITPSVHAAGDVAVLFGIPRDRIWVTPEAADERYVPQKDPRVLQPVRDRYGVRGRYVFNIGGLDVRKNLPVLVRAFAQIMPEIPDDVQLVIGGAPHSANRIVFPPLEPLIRELGIMDRVVLTGRISEDDKLALMQGAAVYVTPSLYEGFGLSVLEAMACGIPVIAANRTSFPEIVGESGLLVEPRVDPVAAALRSILTDGALAAHLRGLGLERAKSFHWRRTAEQTVAVYERVMSDRRRR